MDIDMEKFSLENFPTSESAKKMLGYVSDGFYDESYVGKWIFQVMGIEYDKALEIVMDLPNQFFPETATWGLRYHEIKWQLPVREDLSYEERRRRIYMKRKFRAPMTPYNMERYLEIITGKEVHVSDINDPGEYGFEAEHPNIFEVFFILGEETRDLMPVYKILSNIKQSHTTCHVKFFCQQNMEVRSAAAGGMGNIIKIKARTTRKIEAIPCDKQVSALFVNQNILIKGNDDIREKDVYVLSDDGKKVRALTKNGSVISI